MTPRLIFEPSIARGHRLHVHEVCSARTPEAAALGAQRALADIGHHRLAPADAMISACAHVAGTGVLHYDSDYDLLVEHTGLRFRSEWLAQPGVL